ncbi:MAG: hypothetical protein V8K32_07920 [Candidatus Electrothrix gigas]
MLQNELGWFFFVFSKDFRLNSIEAFQTLIFMALAHFFGFYNPKELADYLGINSSNFYSHLKIFSIYSIKTILMKFMVKQAAENLKEVLEKSPSTISRGGITLSVDNSVIDRFGKMFRCTYSWYSGRWKKVVNGNDLLGVVMTSNKMVFPLHLLFCPKNGRCNTDKPSMLISMLTLLKEEFYKYEIDITQFPITMDSWFASQDLKEKLHSIGFNKIIVAGKGNYVFEIKKLKKKSSVWKKEIELTSGQWGIDVPSCRIKGNSPTFGEVVLFFFKKSTTNVYYLMDFSVNAMRGAEIWHIWKHHNLIEYFWKILKSTFKIKSMRLQGDGIYTGLLVKIFSYLLAVRLKSRREYSKLSIVQIMRKIRRENDLRALLEEHFHLGFPVS